MRSCTSLIVSCGPGRFTALTGLHGIQRGDRIVPGEAVQLPDGGLVRWVGGGDLLNQRTLTLARIPPTELIARLSVSGLTPGQASRLVEWCVARGVLG